MGKRPSSRFTEPFVGIVRGPDGNIVHRGNLTDEQVAVLEARQKAWDLYYATGDESLLVKEGLSPAPPTNS